MPSLLRPHAAPPTAGDAIDSEAPPDRVAAGITGGRTGRVIDSWGTALGVLHALERRLPRPHADAPQPEKRARQRAWTEASARLLAPVRGGRILLEGAPRIGLLRELFPERAPFALPVEALRRMARADRHYRDGVELQVLGHALHPFFGTYVPTRTDHLELFATWLSGWRGGRKRAIDVGTGSGVLAFMLARQGFNEVLATDDNPNAIESVRRDVKRRPEPPPISTWHGDLLPAHGPTADLIVFNPPWLVGPVESPLDAALYTEDPDLIARFVERALPRLSPGGRLVLVYSNLIELVQPDLGHPVLHEIERGRVREVQRLRRKARGSSTGQGRRRRTKERVEVWELAPA